MSDWQPLGCGWRHRKDPEPGDVIALEFAAWEIMDVLQLENHRTQLVLKKLYGAHDMPRAQLTVGRIGLRSLHFYPSGRVPLCSCCANPMPCRTAEAERIAAEEMVIVEKRMARAAIPGICYACGEVITSRQGSLTYPPDEGNVQLPGYPSPRFHTRDNCYENRHQYAADRAKHMPDKFAFDPDYERQERQNL